MGKEPKQDGSAELAMFEEEFKKYQELFGLMGYHVYFSYEPFDDDFAGIVIDQHGMTVRVILNSKLPLGQKPYKDVKREARHEAIHLLIGRVVELGKARCVSADELYEAIEELAHKLEGLVPQLGDS